MLSPGTNSPDVVIGLEAALSKAWHPVGTVAELAATPGGCGPLPVRLLGRDLVIADLGSGPVCFTDRCAHRSVRLSVGAVEDGCLRCAYHGWAYGADGRCVEVPSLPDGPIPARAAVTRHDCAVAYDLVWVRLDGSVPTPLPVHTAWDEPGMRVLSGAPYEWSASALRRIENIIDLSHFAFVHDGSLGRRDQPVPPVPEVTRVGPELRFTYDPPAVPDELSEHALATASEYRLVMPTTVDLRFTYPDGRARHLWFHCTPLDASHCRTYWTMARTDDHDGDDDAYLAFQHRVVGEDEPVATSHVPPDWLPLEPGQEISVRTDKVSIEYRRWLRDLAFDALSGPTAFAHALGLTGGEAALDIDGTTR